jgi:hypothetical protein
MRIQSVEIDVSIDQMGDFRIAGWANQLMQQVNMLIRSDCLGQAPIFF